MLSWLKGFLLGPGWLYFTLPSPPVLLETNGRFPSALGLWGYLSFLLRPYAWFCIFAMVEGVRRALYVVFRENLPGISPVVGAWRLGVKVKEILIQVRMAIKAGPRRPDRLEQLPDGRLGLLSFRPYPWRSGQVVEIGETFYVPVLLDRIRDGSYLGFRHLLRPLEPGEIIRGQVARYSHPGQT